MNNHKAPKPVHLDSVGNKVDLRRSYGYCPRHGEMSECRKINGALRCSHCGSKIK